jgi:hypothetical protein
MSAPTIGLLAKAKGFTGLIWMRMSVWKTSSQAECLAKVRNPSSDGSKPVQTGLFAEIQREQGKPVAGLNQRTLYEGILAAPRLQTPRPSGPFTLNRKVMALAIWHG